MNSTLSTTLGQIRYAGQRQPIKLQQLEQQLSSNRLMVKMEAFVQKKRQARPLPSPDQYEWEDIRIEKPLSQTVRILTTRKHTEPSDFNIFLQAHYAGRWQTVVSYEYRQGRGLRGLFRHSGHMEMLAIDLPRNVILEMAGEDINRNWVTYCDNFFRTDPQQRRAPSLEALPA